MTAGTLADRPAPPHNEPARQFYEHSSAQRVNTDIVVVEALRAAHPQLHLTVVPTYGGNLLAFAAAGEVGLVPIDNEKDRLSWRQYVPPATRLNGGQGVLIDDIQFGKYLLEWKSKEYIVYIANGRDGSSAYPQVVNQYLLSSSVDATNRLLLEAGQWNSELHNEVWVFDSGFWQKDTQLWDSVQRASWDDVILDKGMKKAIIEDVETFFNSRDTYERLSVPWKRGVIYYGPPGNGKTISIKAMMHELYARKEPIPTLYVKSLTGFNGPEYSINSIFTLARRTAPCYLVFEDLDSIVTDQVRSYFLNAVDGISRNDGILMVGSTNHLDRLDPGIAKRPSRFDRKYLFPNPDTAERTAYMKYWQRKLAKNDDLEFPDKICPAVAAITKGFSFAYLQEAVVASLLAIARNDDDDDNDDDAATGARTCLECLEVHGKPASGSTCDRDSKRPFKGLFDWVWSVRRVDEEDPDLDNYMLWREMKKQIRILREEMGEDKSGGKS